MTFYTLYNKLHSSFLGVNNTNLPQVINTLRLISNLYSYFPGNALSMIVLSCPEMQNNFNHLLIGLSSFDTIYLLLSTLIFAMPKLSDNYAMYLLPHIMPIG